MGWQWGAHPAVIVCELLHSVWPRHSRWAGAAAEQLDPPESQALGAWRGPHAILLVSPESGPSTSAWHGSWLVGQFLAGQWQELRDTPAHAHAAKPLQGWGGKWCCVTELEPPAQQVPAWRTAWSHGQAVSTQRSGESSSEHRFIAHCSGRTGQS